MPQNQYVEKPRKVLAEQYSAAASPAPAGVCRCTVTPMFPTGLPHVHTTVPPAVVAPKEGDWIVTEQWTPHDLSIVTNAEFTDRFGGST